MVKTMDNQPSRRSKRLRNKDDLDDNEPKRRKIDDSSDSESDEEVILADSRESDEEELEDFIVEDTYISDNDEDEDEDEEEDEDYEPPPEVQGIQISFVMSKSQDKASGPDLELDEELATETTDFNPKAFLKNQDIPKKIRGLFYERYKQFSLMNSHASEYFKLKKWLTDFTKIPFDKYASLPFDDDDYIEQGDFLRDAINKLDEKLYGQKRAKDELMEILTKWMVNPNSRGQVIGLQGSPGVGKTELAKNCIAPIMQRPFQYISLGGLTDGSYFDGHSYTYEGATHGRMVQMLMDAKCMNPIIFMDELDKVSDSRVGQEIIGKLIHLTDPTQNDIMMDKYFPGVPIDFSKALIIFSFNDPNAIDRILLNRIRVIKMEDFQTDDKVKIARQYLLPQMYKENKLRVCFSDQVLKHIIHKNSEPGVRMLKSDLENIIMKLNVIKMLPEKDPSIQVFNGMTLTMEMYHRIYRAYPSNVIEISRLMMYV